MPTRPAARNMDDHDMTPQRDNVKAGLFVLLGIVLGLICIIKLSDFDSFFAKTQRVRVYYALSDGLQGLQLGAAVKLGGQPVGEVTDIQDFEPDGETTGVRGKIVSVEIPEGVKIYWDARIELDVPPLGTGTSLNIADVGRKGDLYDGSIKIPADTYERYFKEFRTYPVPDPNDAGKTILAMRPIPDGAIPGRVAGSSLSKNFTRDMGIGDAQRTEIKQIIANAKIISEDLKVVSAALASDDANLGDTLANINAVTKTLRDDIPSITASAKRTMDEAEKTVGKIGAEIQLAINDARTSLADVKAVTEDVRKRSGPWFDRIDSITKQTDEVLAQLNAVVKEQSPVVGEAIANIRDVTRTVKESTMTQITEAITKADATLDNLKKASEQVKEVAVGQRPVLERSFANFELTSAQLKLAAIEVRRSPWRLLYEPDDKQLETDNLYDSARSFALAAETLNSASLSLQAVVKDNPDSPHIKDMVSHLQSLFTKFKEAEDQFWKELGKPRKGSK